MDENYTPKSDFLWLAANGEVPLTGSEKADQNLRLLIRFTTDADTSNRDWATMALAMQDIDTPEVRAALLRAADDENVDVRGEAVEGLARRDPAMALFLVERELSQPDCGYGVFVAAAMIADPRLLGLLQRFDADTESPWIDRLVRRAIEACETGVAVRE